VKRPQGILALVGATATGKSALAIEVALRLDGEIISADAFTVYRGFDAGTAKPTAEDRARVPHHLIDIRDPSDPFSAGEFGRLARNAAREVLSRGKLPILCGGTGFYVRSFFDGLFVGPLRDPSLRLVLEEIGKRQPGRLKEMIDLLDPESGSKILRNDAARAIRYLEIVLQTGRRPSSLFRESPGERWELPSRKILLTLPRVKLYERIRQRFQGSMSTCLPVEVEGLLRTGVSPSDPAMSAIGYRDTIEFIEGRIGRQEWEERVVGATRRFSKRQETWFRKESNLAAVAADQEGLISFVLAQSEHLFSED
jgi:tRNA dimethylallyltransferase